MKSYSNEHEAAFLASLCRYLLQQGYDPKQITVITPYVGQIFQLRTQFKQKNIFDVRITAIDNYQGEENDIILLSLVRSNKMNKPGFVKEDNRICVALSRAKCGFYCIGNFNLLRSITKTKLWSLVVADMEQQGLIGESLPLQCVQHQTITLVSHAADFVKTPDGGCNEPCGERVDKCNHVCQRMCHPDDEDHTAPCYQPCTKMCDAGLHECKRRCFEDCGECTESVLKEIPSCKHKQQIPCGMIPMAYMCQEPCTKILTCGHKCVNECGESCVRQCKEKVEREALCGHMVKVSCHLDLFESSRECKKPCGAELACGHICKGSCGECRQGRLHKPCEEKCTRILTCGHPCDAKCAKNCPPCSRKSCPFKCMHGKCGHGKKGKCSNQCRPCPYKCKWQCKHLKCTRKCDEPCDRERCEEPCTKKLKCGHPCLGMCGEPCPPVCHKCDTVKSMVELIYFDEHEEDAQYRFIQLRDCGHIYAVEALDAWMDSDQDNSQVQWKSCLKCKTPIMKTLRYCNIAKQVKLDLNRVKRKEYFFLSETQRKEIIDEIGKAKMRSTGMHYSQSYCNMTDVELQRHYVYIVTASDMLQVVLQSTQLQRDHNPSDESRILAENLDIHKSQANDVFDLVNQWERSGILTDQMKLDMSAECKRLHLLKECYRLQCTASFSEPGGESDKEDFEKLKQFCETSLDRLSEEEYQELLKKLRDIQERQRCPLTEKESKMIIKAMSTKPGSWYRCPKGHLYNIGSCGGAMEVGQCPECGSEIGGERHKLLETNKHAGDFDGSKKAAWPIGDDMQNYAEFNPDQVIV